MVLRRYPVDPDENGNFGDIVAGRYISSSTSSTYTDTWYRMLSYMHADSYRDYVSKNRGLSVRCLKN